MLVFQKAGSHFFSVDIIMSDPLLLIGPKFRIDFTTDPEFKLTYTHILSVLPHDSGARIVADIVVLKHRGFVNQK